MPESILHLVFSAAGINGLQHRLKSGDRVVLMPGCVEKSFSFVWPQAVDVFTLSSEGPCEGDAARIDYREFVRLTNSNPLILSW